MTTRNCKILEHWYVIEKGKAPTFCSAVEVRCCSRAVMLDRLCSNAATTWAYRKKIEERRKIRRDISNKNINILHMNIVSSVNCSFENWPKKKWNLLLRYRFQFITTPNQPVGWKRSILHRPLIYILAADKMIICLVQTYHFNFHSNLNITLRVLKIIEQWNWINLLMASTKLISVG